MSTSKGCVSRPCSDKHVFDRKTTPIGKDWQHYIGQDSGYRDATAILRIAKDPEDRYFVYNEYYRGQADLSDHASYINRPNFTGEHILRVFADSSDESNRGYTRGGVDCIALRVLKIFPRHHDAPILVVFTTVTGKRERMHIAQQLPYTRSLSLQGHSVNGQA